MPQTVLGKDDFFRSEALNLDKSPVRLLEGLILAYNGGSLETIKEAKFSSMASTKTFAILLDTIVRHHDLVAHIRLNTYQDPPSHPVTVKMDNPADWAYLDGGGNKLGNSWWLSDTRVVEAWNYSIGTGVNVALLDSGYDRLPHPDLPQSRRLVEGTSGDTGTSVLAPAPFPDEGHRYHGLYAALTLGGERDNDDNVPPSPSPTPPAPAFRAPGTGTAGVAPNATIIAHNAGPTFAWNYSKILRNAVNDSRTHVIAINHNFDQHNWAVYVVAFIIGLIFAAISFFLQLGVIVGSWIQGLSKEQVDAGVAAISAAVGALIGGAITGLASSSWMPEMEQLIRIAVNDKKIPVIVSAHNEKANVNNWFPARLVKDYPIIVVGAVEPKLGAVRSLDTADNRVKDLNNFPNGDPALDTNAKLIISDFSNYGEGLVWAPGNYIKVAHRQAPFGSGHSKLEEFSGTSAAGPFVTGVVALLKSRRPDLEPRAINDILRRTSRITVDKGGKSVSENVKLIDALKALEDALGSNCNVVGSNCHTNQAEPVTIGYVHNNSGKRELWFNKHAVSDPTAKPEDKQKSLLPSIHHFDDAPSRKYDGKLVKILGWTNTAVKKGNTGNLSASEIETSVVEEYKAKPQITSFSATTKGSGNPPVSGAISELKIQGQDLYDPKNGIKFYVTDSSGAAIPGSPFPATNVFNDGTTVEAELPALGSGNYSVRVEGFNGTATSASSTGFNVKNFDFGNREAVFGLTIPGVGVTPNTNNTLNPIPGTPPVKALPKEVVFAAVRGKLEGATVKIGNVNVPVLAVVKDLIAFGVPENLPADLYDVLIQSASAAAGETLTFKQALEILAPPPAPSPPPGDSEPPPVVVSGIATRVSRCCTSDMIFPFDRDLFSVLKTIQDNFGVAAEWVGFSNLANPIRQSYPTVPDIRNPGQVDRELPIKIDLQVAFNQQKGGIIKIRNAVESFSGTEGSVMTVRFPFAASEDTGMDVEFKLNGSDTHAQIIYVLKAEP